MPVVKEEKDLIALRKKWETEQFMAKIKALIVCFDKYSRGLNYRVDKLQNPL